MLVLSRHRDESIMIGDDIVVTVVDIRGDKVRLGIDAAQDIPVHRQEVYEAIKRENEKVARLRPEDTRNADSGNQGFFYFGQRGVYNIFRNYQGGLEIRS